MGKFAHLIINKFIIQAIIHQTLPHLNSSHSKEYTLIPNHSYWILLM